MPLAVVHGNIIMFNETSWNILSVGVTRLTNRFNYCVSNQSCQHGEVREHVDEVADLLVAPFRVVPVVNQLLCLHELVEGIATIKSIVYSVQVNNLRELRTRSEI